MEVAKNFLQKYFEGFPKISFKDEPFQIGLKIIGGKITEFKDNKGITKEGLLILVKKENENKYCTFLTSSFSLIQKLAEIEEGTIVNIELKRKFDGQQIKSYFIVEKISKESLTEEDNEALQKFIGEEEEIEEF